MGRRFKLTPDRVQKVCESIAEGHTYAYAAVSAGLSERTLHRYRADADEALMRFENGEELTEREAFLAQFSLMVEEAEHDAEAVLLGRIKAASKDYWQAAAWIMERRWPERWSRSAKIRKEEERVIRVQMDLGAPTKARVIDAENRKSLPPAPREIEIEAEFERAFVEETFD